MRLLSFLSALLLALPIYSTSKAPLFSVSKKDQIRSLNLTDQKIIHEHNEFLLSVPTEASIQNQDYYFVQLPKSTNFLNSLSKRQSIVLNHNNQFAVVKIENEKDLLALATKLHSESHACGMIQKINGEPVVVRKINPPQVSLVKKDEVSKVIGLVSKDRIVDVIKTMSSWKTRFHSTPEGELVGEKLKEFYEELIPEDRKDIEIELFSHKSSSQQSIIVRIPGTKSPEEIVILGSHIDSLNQRDNSNAPGADDNASGTSTNIEVFRALMQSGFYPEKTIEIHGYAAEEIGLVGSGEIASNYKAKNKKVLSMVQFDMNGYAGNGDKITFVSNGTNSSLNKQLMELSKTYLSVPATSAYLLFGSSDHASWSKQGFPVAFPTEDTFQFNRKIHSANDTLSGINSPNQMKEFGKLGVAYLMHFSKN